MKSYKPVTLSDPVGYGNVVRLLPCQALELHLACPQFYRPGACGAACRLAVKVNSPWLISTQYERDHACLDVTLMPRYDFSAWQEFRELYLGNIEITIEDNESPHAIPFRSLLCVTQAGNRNILTVVNPHNNLVRLELGQTLEVICSEASWNNWEPGKPVADGYADRWTYATWHWRVPELKASCLGTQLVGRQISPNGFTDLPANPAIQLKLPPDPARQALREHHFYFALTPESHPELNRLANGLYAGTEFNFFGAITADSTQRGLFLCYAVSEKTKQMLPYYLNSNRIEDRMQLRRRVQSTDGGTLTNPCAMEWLSFDGERNSLTIELLQPNIIWADLPADAQWQAEVEPKNQLLSVQSLPTEYRWGIGYQKFRIVHYYTPSDQETKFLGMVSLVCPERKGTAEGKKDLNFWVTPPEQCKASRIVPVASATGAVSSFYTVTKPSASCCEVSFAALPVTDGQLKGDTNRTTLVSEVTTGLDAHTHFFGACVKKKQKKAASKKALTTTVGLQETSIHYNPEHCQQIIVDYGKEIILMLAKPAQLLAAAVPEDELWTVTQLDHQVHVRQHNTALIGNTTYQRVQIHLEPQRLSPGLHHCGAIRLQCSVASRLITFAARITEPLVSVSLPVSEEGFSHAKPDVRASLSNQKRWLVLQTWEHNQAVALTPYDCLFVRQPQKWRLGRWSLQVEQYPLPGSIEKCSDAGTKVNPQEPWLPDTPLLRPDGSLLLRSLADRGSHLVEIAIRRLQLSAPGKDVPIMRLTFRNDGLCKNRRIADGVLRQNRVLERTLYVLLTGQPLAAGPRRPRWQRLRGEVECGRLGLPASPVILDPKDGHRITVRADQDFRLCVRSHLTMQIYCLPPWVTFVGKSYHGDEQRFLLRCGGVAGAHSKIVLGGAGDVRTLEVSVVK